MSRDTVASAYRNLGALIELWKRTGEPEVRSGDHALQIPDLIDALRDGGPLSEPERTAVYWALVKDEPRDQVADRMGVKKGTVANYVRSACDTLAKLWS